MELDPTRWLVALAGFVYDWIMTREWKRIFLAMIPLILLAVVGGLVWAGNRMDRSKLASWYMELGDQEILAWEDAWAPEVSEEPTAPEDGTEEALPVPEDPLRNELTRFTEVLFRRVQLLEPSDRSQFVVGATLAQRGALEQAERILSKVAPDDRQGYPPAHAFLALVYLRQLRETKNVELVAKIKHHAEKSKEWDRTPEEVLLAGSELHRVSDVGKAIELLERAAARNPLRWLDVMNVARNSNDRPAENNARDKGKKVFTSRLTADEADDQARAALVQLYLTEGPTPENLQLAEQLLDEAPEMTPVIKRARSEVLRARYRASIVGQGGDRYSADIGLLQQALDVDPTNPFIAQEVALLSRVEGVEATEQLKETLRERIAQGKATGLTHYWLAEVHLVEKDYAKALPHLEQVVTRLPLFTQALNNLAYVLAELHPERLDEAEQYAKRAIVASARDPNADFYDTLGIVFGKQGKTKESITAFEMAISIDPQRIDFHERAADAYRSQGNEAMAVSHEKVIQRLREAAAAPTPPAVEPAAVPAGESQPAESQPAESQAAPQ